MSMLVFLINIIILTHRSQLLKTHLYIYIHQIDIILIFTQVKQGGFIGIVAFAFMYEPLRDEEMDRQAVSRALAFSVAW